MSTSLKSIIVYYYPTVYIRSNCLFLETMFTSVSNGIIYTKCTQNPHTIKPPFNIATKSASLYRYSLCKSNKVAKIRNRYNQVPHLTQDTNGKVTNSQKTPQTRAKRSALSQQVTTKHI